MMNIIRSVMNSLNNLSNLNIQTCIRRQFNKDKPVFIHYKIKVKVKREIGSVFLFFFLFTVYSTGLKRTTFNQEM
jgi:hypothetical protein